MPRNRLAYDNCPAARTLDVVGERWALLVVREALNGASRFDEFRDRLGISENTLARRLHELVDREVLESRPYAERPTRHAYRLTARGRDLVGVLAALAEWGQQWVPPDPELPEPGRPTWLPAAAAERAAVTAERAPATGAEA